MRRIVVSVFLLSCGARSQIAAPETKPDANACSKPPAQACEHLRVVGPLALTMLPAAVIARADGFDCVGAGVPQQEVAQRVVVGDDSLALGETHVFEPMHGPPVLAGERVATLYEAYGHTRFATFDSNYALLSDIDFDDGHDLCTWRHLTCTEAQCFAACAANPGPRFVVFDVATGAIVRGPDDGEFTLQGGGEGAIVPLSCAPPVWVATNGLVTFARVDAQVLEVDQGTAVYGQNDPLVWPYDWSSIIWLSEGWTIKRFEPSGHVSVFGTDAITEDEILVEWAATNIGLVRIDGRATVSHSTTSSTTLRVHVVRPDGSITKDVMFDTDGYINEWAQAPIASGLAFAWHEQHDGKPPTSQVVVIQCADASD